jgi:hypothetical protein
MRAAVARSPAASFLLAAAAAAAVVGGLYFWVVVSSFRLPDSGAVGCRPDGEGSWSVGMFYGSSPLELRPIELVSGGAGALLEAAPFACWAGAWGAYWCIIFGGQEGRSNGNSSAWPVANPVLTCATPTEAGYPSNFVADPFLYVEVSAAATLSPGGILLCLLFGCSNDFQIVE